MNEDKHLLAWQNDDSGCRFLGGLGGGNRCGGLGGRNWCGGGLDGWVSFSSGNWCGSGGNWCGSGGDRSGGLLN